MPWGTHTDAEERRGREGRGFQPPPNHKRKIQQQFTGGSHPVCILFL
jgi:hypothetical protein